MSHVISRNLRLIGLTLSIIRTSYPLGQQTRPSYQELNNEERSVALSQNPVADNPVGTKSSAQYPSDLKIPSLKIHSISKSRRSKSIRSQNPVEKNCIFFCNLRHFFSTAIFLRICSFAEFFCAYWIKVRPSWEVMYSLRKYE